MAEADWAFLLNSSSAGSIDRGPTSGVVKPNGGSNFVFGFNSLTNVASAAGLHIVEANFNPMAKGASIRGAVKRGASGGPLAFSPFLFLGAQGNDIADNAYLLGLEDDDPHQIVLRKGQINGGISDDDAGTGGILKKGTETFPNDTWLHLRLDMIVNGNGDVILQAFRSDLDSEPVTAPVWVAIPGLEEFIDDSLGIGSGTAPLTSGRGGFGFVSGDITRRAFFDHIEILRQV